MQNGVWEMFACLYLTNPNSRNKKKKKKIFSFIVQKNTDLNFGCFYKVFSFCNFDFSKFELFLTIVVM